MRTTFIYTLLHAIQVCLALAFQILLARTFAVSPITDAYLVSIVLTEFMAGIGVFFTVMFLQHYSDLRQRDAADGERFYRAAYTVSLGASVLVFAVSVASIDVLARAFAPGFDLERLQTLKAVFTIIAFSLIWGQVVTLNNFLLNAEMYFIVPGIVGLLTPACNILSLLLFAESYSILALAYSVLVGGITGLLIQQVYIWRRLRMRPGLVLWHQKIPRLVADSFSVALASRLWCLKDPMTTSLMSFFPPGTVTVYLYAARIIGIVFAITNIPISQIFLSQVSRWAAEQRFQDIQSSLRKTVLRCTTLFSSALIPLVVVLPFVLQVLFGSKFDPEDLEMMYYFVLALIPFHLVLSVQFPFENIAKALKQGWLLVKASGIFVLTLGISAWLLQDWLGIFVIPAALCLAQLQNLGMYLLNTSQIFHSRSFQRVGPEGWSEPVGRLKPSEN